MTGKAKNSPPAQPERRSKRDGEKRILPTGAVWPKWESVSDMSCASCGGNTLRCTFCEGDSISHCAYCEGNTIKNAAQIQASSSKRPYDKHRSYYDELWATFESLDANALCPIPSDLPSEKNSFIFVEADPLLFHCKVYVLAEKYLAFPLAKLAFRNLHRALSALPRDKGSIQDIVNVLQYCFRDGESRLTSRDSALRKIVVAFAAARAPELKMLEGFRELLDEYPELSSDFVMVLG